jgi:hypothetical protein
MTGSLEAPLNHVSMRRFSEGLLERTQEVRRASLRYSTESLSGKHHAGLQSFRSMRRIDVRRRNASALRLRFSQSFASRRQRLSYAIVRSTTPTAWKHHKSFGSIGALDDFSFEMGKDFRQGLLEFRSLIAASPSVSQWNFVGMQEDRMVAPKLATSRLPRSGDAPETSGRPCTSEEAG